MTTLTHECFEEVAKACSNALSNSVVVKTYTSFLDKTLYFSFDNVLQTKKVYCKADDAITEDMLQCNGIDVQTVYAPHISKDKLILLTQNKEFDGDIFEAIIEDIRKTSNKTEDRTIAYDVYRILSKWRDFLVQKKPFVLSPASRQGLFGELLLLRDLILNLGVNSVYNWGGCKGETNDFYVYGNGIEVKTTNSNPPYSMHISSEFQLDLIDVNKKIFLVFYALKSSDSDGQTLPELIADIKKLIGDELTILEIFEEKLEEYGYIDCFAKQYTQRYSIRDNKFFDVTATIPKITPKNIMNGISNVNYEVLVEACNDFIRSKDLVMRYLINGEH